MKLNINYDSNSHLLKVDRKLSISEVKSKLEGIVNTPAKMMTLQFKNKILNDKNKLKDCGIRNGDELTLTLIEGEGGCFDMDPFKEVKILTKMSEK